MIIETNHLTIQTTSESEMRNIIEKRTDQELIKAYSEKPQECLANPSLAVNSILKFPTCATGKHQVFKIELEKTVKYGIINLTELPGANNTWDQAER